MKKEKHLSLAKPLSGLFPFVHSSLYDNQIQSLADSTFAPLTNIERVHLGKNPLICDCNLRWMARWIASLPADEGDQNGVEKSDAQCDSPKRVAGKRLTQLTESEFKCGGAEEYRTK